MKVVQIVPSIGEEASGPSYSVPGLCRGLQEVGCDVSLHFSGAMPRREFTYPASAYPISRFPHPRLARSPEMLRGVCKVAESVDIIHNNSFWMYPNVYGYKAMLAAQKCSGEKGGPKLVNAPRGTLAAWAMAHHKLQKRLFAVLGGQNAAMAATDMWHATCEKEYEEIRALGYRQPVAIVPIGMDIPEECSNVRMGECSNGWGTPGKKKLVFFGRLHAVKNIDMLVRAWELICRGEKGQAWGGWELVIAGPDGGVRGPLEAEIAERHIPRVRFVGEINGAAKYEFLTQADLYVLPSKTENFGVTLAEALACGTPSLGSAGTPWEVLTECQCGIWGFSTAETLAENLVALMSLTDEERKAMGIRGQQLIRDRFSWQAIGQQMKQAYQWLLDTSHIDRPDWVVVS